MQAIAVAPRTPSARARPPRSMVAAAMPAPIPARTTLVSGSVIARNPAATASEMAARATGRRRSIVATMAAAATSTPTLKPLIASTWLIPASRNAAACAESPGSRTPVVIAETSARTPPSAHPGMPSRRARFAAPRTASSHRPGPEGVRSSTSAADGTSSAAVGSLARDPGLSGDARHDIHPRTRTSDPRGGRLAMPATRTGIRPWSADAPRGRPSAPAVTMPRASSANDCAASLRRNPDIGSDPPSMSRGAVATVPSTTTGMPSTRGPPVATGERMPGSPAFEPINAMPTAHAHAATARLRAATQRSSPSAASTAAAPRGIHASAANAVPCTAFAAMAPHHMHAAATAASGSGAPSGPVRCCSTPRW